MARERSGFGFGRRDAHLVFGWAAHSKGSAASKLELTSVTAFREAGFPDVESV
jgi:hypothetical protein